MPPPDVDHPSHGYVVLPDRDRSPWWALGQRLLIGIGIIAFTVLLVYADRGGYRDANDAPAHTIGLVDSIYYSTVTLSTTVGTPSVLTTDVSNGLQIAVKSCAVAWTQGGTAAAPTYTCSSGERLLGTGPVVGNMALNNPATSAPGGSQHE